MLYLHVPKTAGTTLIGLLEEQFQPKEICALEAWLDLPKYDVDYSPFRFLRGHVAFEIGKVLPRPLRIVTMLRDPIERTLSNYEMMRRQPGDPWHLVVKDMSIGEFVASPLTRHLFENTQTRLFGSTWDIQRITDITAEKERIPADLLAVAKDRLAGCDFVGLTERFQESLDLLTYTFGWFPRSDIESRNVAPVGRLQRDELAPKVLHQLEDRVHLDLELYRFAETLFAERRAAMVNDLLRAHWRSCWAGVFIDQANADFCAGWAGVGWYGREIHPDHGCFRWIGPGVTATVWLPLPAAQHLTVSFQVIAACSEATLEGLQFTVNGEPIDLSANHHPRTGQLFSGRIPPKALQLDNQVAELTWTLPHTRKPGEWMPGNPDPRALGLALNLIQIKPA